MKQKAGLSWTFVVALMLSSAACTGAEDSSEPTPASSTSTPSLLEQVVADYNVRNDAAIAAAEHYDSSLWTTAHMGAVLESDLYQTRYNEVFNKPAEPTTRFQRIQQFGTAPDGYPRWVVGAFAALPDPSTPSSPSSATASPSVQSTDPDAKVVVFEQATDGAPWLMSQSIWTSRADLPGDAAAGAATLEQQQNATVIGQLFAKWLTSGEAPPWLELGQASELRAKEVDPGEFSERFISCSLYSDPSPRTSVSDAVRVVRAGSTSLIAVSMKCSTTTVAAKNSGVGWKDGFEKLHPNEPPGAFLGSPWVAMVLLAHGDGANPVVIGVTAEHVL